MDLYTLYKLKLWMRQFASWAVRKILTEGTTEIEDRVWQERFQ